MIYFSLCRDIGQGSVEEIRSKDLKRDLEERERSVKDKSDRKGSERDREKQNKAILSAPSSQ